MNQTTDSFAPTSQLSVQSSWQVYGASSIGKSHIDSNLPNQDSIYLQKTEHGMVAVVCDGAGSAKFSQAGAAFFSQSIGKMLLSLGVSRSVSSSGITLDLGQLTQQIIEQLSQIRLDLQSQLPAESSLRDYHTTFTGLLIHSNHQALLVQIGDSPLTTSQFVVRHPHIDYFTNLQVYGDDSKNEYVNETHFITQDNWQSFLRVEPIDLSQVDCLALMSDGCADLVFEGASVTPKIYRPFFGNLLFNLTQSQCSQQGSAIIEQALGNPATYRLTGDDKSLVVLLKNQQHYQNLEPMVEVQNEALANDTIVTEIIATAPNNPTVWHTDAVNHKNTRATSTPDDLAFNNINNIAHNPKPQASVVDTAPATPAATTSQVLPPSQSVSDSTRQRRNTAMMAGAVMLIGTGILGWINKDRLLPTQTVNNVNTAASVASTTPTSAITTPLIAHALGDSYAINLTEAATVTESGNPSDDPIFKVIIASPQGQSIDVIEQKSKQTSSAKTKNDNKNENKNNANQPLLSATVTTVVANKNPTVASGAASTALQNQHTDAALAATLTDSQFNNHAVKLAAKASCLPVTDTHDLTSLGVTIQPTMNYYNCQISLPIKSMTSQIAELSKKTEILDSLTLDNGLSEILTSSTIHTAATASSVTGTGLPASTVSDSGGNQQIQLYYLGVTEPVNHMSATASTELAALPTSSAHLKR